MEDDNPLGFFGDDLIDASPVKYKSQKSSGEPTLEEWVCRQKRTTLLNWINKNMQEKIQKFLSYPWNNPSERVKQHITTLLSEEKIHGSPIYALCAQGDPSDGQLLRIFLTYFEGADLGNYDFCDNLSTFSYSCLVVEHDCQQYFISVAIASSKLTSAQLRYILTHPKVVDPFKSNPEATHYYSPDECAIDISIRHKNAEYFKELLLLCKVRSLACSNPINIKYFRIRNWISA